jgi:FkbM family methyltransferase
MALLNTFAKLAPRPLRRRCRDFLLDWNPSTYLRSHDAELEVTLDSIVSDYGRTHPDIYFLQVGAFDGISTDPLYPLIDKHALKGILVEPQREFFDRLKANYARFEESRFLFVNAAIAETDTTRPFYRVTSRADGPEWLHGIASLDRAVLMRHRSAIPELDSLVESENVRCVTFSSLFRECRIKHVDLLQIDAEGFDGVILRLFDIPNRRPAIVRFEHKHLSTWDYKSCLSLLIHQGYKVAISRTGDTLAYHADS